MAITAVLRFCDVSSSVTAARSPSARFCLSAPTDRDGGADLHRCDHRPCGGDFGHHGLIVSIVGLAALFLVLTAAWRFGARFIVTAMQQEAHRLRLEVAHRVLDPRGVRTDLRSGELLTVSTSDAEQTSWIADIVPRALRP